MTTGRWLLALIIALVAGCATTPTPSPTAPAAPAPETEAASEGEHPPSSDGATLALLRQSERAAASGALEEALSYAERAVRIEPRRADLWIHLASLELANADPATAMQYANKALTLARDRPDWQRQAWLVIADAHDALGEHDRAAEIRERWRTGRG